MQQRKGYFIVLGLLLCSCSGTGAKLAPIEYHHKMHTAISKPTGKSVVLEEHIVQQNLGSDHGDYEKLMTELETILPPEGENPQRVGNHAANISNIGDNVSGERDVSNVPVNRKITYHEVQIGETIEDVSQKYKQKIADIAVLNMLDPPYSLDEGQILKIYVPHDRVKQHVVQDKDKILIEEEIQAEIVPSNAALNDKMNADLSKPKAKGKGNNVDDSFPQHSLNAQARSKMNGIGGDSNSISSNVDAIAKNKIVANNPPEIPKEQIRTKQQNNAYIKPIDIDGKVISKFGAQTEFGANKGISIAASAGTKVLAAAAGKVIYADYDATYGNLVIIKLHDKNVITSYAHMQDVVVKKGANIMQGEVIGYVGSTGKVKKPQLHFGIREGKVAKDPLKFIK